MTSPVFSVAERIEARVARGIVTAASWGPIGALVRRTAPPNGESIDPGVRALLALRLARGAKTTNELGAARARVRFTREAQLHAGDVAQIAESRDLTLPLPSGSQRARLYVPLAVPSPSPLLVYFHGGGYVMGDIEMFDAFCRQLARDSGARVLSVEYALAPEHPFPAALDDGFAAFGWAVANAASLGADPARIGVGGDSAGGNLSAVTSQRCAREGGPQPKVQLLIYPAVDRTGHYPSLHRYANDFLLTREEIEWYHETYTGGPHVDRADPRISPLHGELRGVAPAVVVTAGLDPLCDEGDAYAEALRQAGVRCVHEVFSGHVHGFINMTGPSPACRAAVTRLARLCGTELRR